jgi:DNA-binding GntR family transcriptional regulator
VSVTTPLDPIAPGNPAPVAASGHAPAPRATARRTRASYAQPVDRVLEELHQDLADGAFSPRERLVEADLVERYRAPRAAVREALIQLASEGLVEREAHRGARVRGMSISEAIEMAEVRRALESISVVQAAIRATGEERQAIVALAEALCDAARAGDVGTYLRLNAHFHRSIDAMARHQTARSILAQFARRPIDRFLPEPFRAVPPTASVEAHRRIAAAIGAADPVAAEAAMHDHLTDLVEMLRRFERGAAGDGSR